MEEEYIKLIFGLKLSPIGEILQSKLLQEIPLDLFGIEKRDLIEIIANAPSKVNAFISTLIEISKNYNLTRESFFLTALRSLIVIPGSLRFKNNLKKYWGNIRNHPKRFTNV